MWLGLVEFLACLGIVGWHEIRDNRSATWLETTIAIADGMESMIVVLVTGTVIAVEGPVVLAERYLRKRFDAGRAEGKVEGRVEERMKWEEWNGRRVAAEREGRRFEEPPPSSP